MYVIVKYSNNIIQGAFDKIKKLNREVCLKKAEKKKTDRIPLVIPFHPSLPNISNIIRKHRTVLCKKQPGAKVFCPSPLWSVTREKIICGIFSSEQPSPLPCQEDPIYEHLVRVSRSMGRERTVHYARTQQTQDLSNSSRRIGPRRLSP